jgi:hypothetical protein
LNIEDDCGQSYAILKSKQAPGQWCCSGLALLIE